MIKLKQHLNYKGLIYEPGAIVSLAPDAEKRMLDNGLADSCIPGEPDEEVAKPQAEMQSDIEATEQEEPQKNDTKRANRKRT